MEVDTELSFVVKGINESLAQLKAVLFLYCVSYKI